jgi:class 3 adenylate cyclase/tetratricopeptide (TPR) repeat protein
VTKTEREQLVAAMAQLEAQRDLLGDTAVDAALEALRAKLAELEGDQGRIPGISIPLGGERKIVTVMFADISGFTAMSENMDPEAVRDIMNDCFELLVPIIAKYEGTVDKFIGDEIMALFGAPVTHENDPERALRAALEMVDALEDFNGKRDLQLGLHFGINSGRVVAGGVGSSERKEYSVMGDAVNVAARLEEVSEKGEILVGPDTYRFTSTIFRFENLDPIHVKGKSEPVHAHRLTGLMPGAVESHPYMRERVVSPLVGRDNEFNLVSGCLESLYNGVSGILSIIGEAGLGKSRVVAEIRDHANSVERYGSLQWFEGRTLSFFQTISYRPFQEILMQYANISDDEPDIQAWKKLEDCLIDLFGDDISEVLPYLASVLALEVRGHYVERVRYLDGEAMRRQIFLASRRFFEQIARKSPLVLVFEDLHWVDDSSALLLEHLMQLVTRVPLLIVMVSRPDTATPSACVRDAAQRDYSEYHTEIQLSPLSQPSSSKLVGNLLDIGYLPQQVHAMILQRAEGNPFFLEEIIRSLLDRGKLVRDPTTGKWKPVEHVESIMIPETVQGIVMARVDRLDREVRQVLRTASVVGRSFFYQVLHSIENADNGLDQCLVELEATEFIRRKRTAPDLEFIFKHALAQQAIYESILLQKRRLLHAQVGLAIEKLYGDRLDEFSSLLANHFAKAEYWDKAQEYLLKAGDQAGRLAADTEALAHYRQALDAYDRASGERLGALQRVSLERKMGEAMFRRGEHEHALQFLNHALTFLNRPLPSGGWKVRLAILIELSRQVFRRLFCHDYVEQAGNTISPEIEEELRIYEVMGWIDAFADYEHLFMVALRALNVSEKKGFGFGVCRGYMALGTICDLYSLFLLADSYHRKATAVAEAINFPPASGLVNTGKTLHSVCLGDWDTAVKYGNKGAEIHHRTGDLRGWGYNMYMIAVANAYQGNLAAALSNSRMLVKLGQDGADSQVQCWGLATEGFVLRLMERPAEAVIQLRTACETAEKIRDNVVNIWGNAELARSYVQQERFDLALTALKRSVKFHEAYRNLRLIWVTLAGARAEVSIALYERSSGSDGSEWFKSATRASRTALAQGRSYKCTMPEALRFKGTLQYLKGKPASAAKWWDRSIGLADSLGQECDMGMTLLEKGRRLDDIDCLTRGKSLLERIRTG